MDISQLYALEMMRKRRLSVGTVDLGYSTDGLIMHLDAIQNVRTGAHRNDVTVWHDLSANQWDVSLFGHTWGGDYCAFTGQEGSYGYSPQRVTFAGAGTLELVFLNNHGPASYGGVAGWIKTAVPSGRFGAFRGPASDPALVIFGASIAYATPQVRTYRAANSTRASVNGSFYNINATIPNGVESSSGFYLASSENTNSQTPNPSAMYNTQICAIRVYTRNLSDAEMNAHRAIDVARFSFA